MKEIEHNAPGFQYKVYWKMEGPGERWNIRDIYDWKTGKIGMISHKKSLKTIFGHKHKIKNFIKKFYIFHKQISTAFNFGLYLE